MNTLAQGARIEIKDGVAHRIENGHTQTFEIKELPEAFVRWQLDYKRSVYNAIEKDEYVAFNAGHLPVLMLGETGVLRIAESTGPALGVLPNASFRSDTLALAPGDTVVLYSDGVTEAFDADGSEFGEETLRRLLPSLIHEGAAQVCHHILDAVRRHTSGTRATDDVTVMAVKRLGGA